MTAWTIGLVERRLREAADTRRHLSCWLGAGVGSTSEPDDTPASDAIERMEEAQSWLRWLSPADAEIAWIRAEGARWKLICWRFAISRATAHRRWRHATKSIACRLNGVVIRNSAIVEKRPAAGSEKPARSGTLVVMGGINGSTATPV